MNKFMSICVFFFYMIVFAEAPLSVEVLESVYTNKNESKKPASIDKESSVDENIKINDQKTRKKHNTSNKNFKNKNEEKSSVSEKSSIKLKEYLIRKEEFTEIKTPLKIPKNNDYAQNVNLSIGTKVRAVINSNIIAYRESKSPITATILDGELKGFKFFGNATMDEQTKRVNIEFKSLKSPTNIVFKTTSLVQDHDGNLGLDATHESFYWNYFLAEAALNTASGFADASTKRSKNAFGSSEVDPSIDSTVKQGVATGLSRSADRIGEKIRNAPEYVTAKGPFIVQVIVVE